ncbi:MAG: DNA-protecting protein DprA [Proteobacteria bacterium]|nr:DNA-protecting protein DprA [Pseudomonadota bacterium]
MAIYPQLEAIITYTLSQLIYRWLPLPRLDSSHLPRIDISQLSTHDWLDYIEQRLPMEWSDLAWTRLFVSKQLSTFDLSTLIFENIQRTVAGGATLIDYYHPAYPSMLSCIADAPSCLVALGNVELLDLPAIAMVGSRKASGLALRETEDLAADLASEGLAVVSGGAIGCDMASHVGALRSGERPCPTIVVMAGGLSRLYPRCHERIFKRLKDGGALFLSERLWEYPARPYDFPIRNRIISGLVPRLLLMQAGERSGAKLTARMALDQGREVFVLVHPNSDVRAKGSHDLLAEGATPFFSAQDYLRLAWPFDTGSLEPI